MYKTIKKLHIFPKSVPLQFHNWNNLGNKCKISRMVLYKNFKRSKKIEIERYDTVFRWPWNELIESVNFVLENITDTEIPTTTCFFSKQRLRKYFGIQKIHIHWTKQFPFTGSLASNPQPHFNLRPPFVLSKSVECVCL